MFIQMVFSKVEVRVGHSSCSTPTLAKQLFMDLASVFEVLNTTQTLEVPKTLSKCGWKKFIHKQV